MTRPSKCTRCGAALPASGDACSSCGSVVQAELSDAIAPGTRIAGKYEVSEEIGAGGMGRVYRAIQQPLGTTVCVKTLHTGGTADPQFAVRFEREAKTTSLMRHPNIVSVFDYGMHTDGMTYLVMEYVDGENLARLLKQGQIMSAARAVHILGQVCDALAFAHSRGVIHRDLKPANIMVVHLPGDPDHVKVLDFGSAVMLEDEDVDRLTRVGTVIGTPAYMAPEYILGRGLDARVDVYAVGTLLYTLLCGGPPFRGNAQAVFAQQVSVPPMPPRRRNPQADVSPALETVILRALVKDPAKRYATAAELKDAMTKALAGARDEAFEYEDAGRTSIEVATQERPVVLVSITGEAAHLTALSERIRTLGQARGGLHPPQKEPGQPTHLCFAFGLDRDGPEAAADAARFALEIAAVDPGRPLRVGLRDAQASCRGAVGSAAFAFELFGNGVDIANRLASHARPGSALASGPVSRVVPTDLRLAPVMPPPELQEPAFALSDPLQTASEQHRLPFAGRASEQRALLEIAANARGGLVGIVEAPAGLGKTRLVEEIVPQAARVGVVWCLAPSSPQMEIGPSHPVSIVAALGWTAPGQSSSTTERYAVDAMLGRFEQLADGLSGERRQLRLVSSALEGLSRRLEQTPVVVVFDQLHDADDLTWALARRVVDMTTALHVSVVLCAHEVSEIPFPMPADAKRITLGPLTEKEVLSLAAAPSGPGMDAARAASLARASRGIPLLAEELFRAADHGGQGMAEAVSSLSLPDAAGKLVLARLEALGSSAARVLRGIAVLGLAPRESEVRALLEDAPPSAQDLAELQQAALISRDPNDRLCFLFPLARDVVLGTIPEQSLRELRRRAARLLSATAATTLRLGAVGEHLLLAGDHAEAFDVLHRAADAARAEGSTRQAIEVLRMAVRAGDALGDEQGEGRALVAKKLGELLIQSGRLLDAEKVLRWSFPKARAQRAHGLAADLLRLHGRVLVLQGHKQDGRGEIEASLKFAEGKGFQTIAAEACGDLADVSDADGENEKAAEILRRGLALIDAREDRESASVRIQLYNRLGRIELQAENVPGAIALFTQALSLAERIQDRYQGAGLLGNLGGAYARRGELARALHFTERALRASEALGDQIGVARQSHNLALLRLASGQSGAARQLLRTSLDAARRAGWRQGLEMSKAALEKLESG